MPTQRFRFPPRTLMRRLANIYRTLPSRGFLLDGPAHVAAIRFVEPATVASGQPPSARIPAADLALFVTRSRELLAATDESMRQQLENDVLDLAVPLHAAGMFEILGIAHPALANMVSDHLAESAPWLDSAREPA